LFFKLMRRLALIGLLPLLVVVVFCPLLMPWVFGDAWREAGYVSAIIAPWLYAALIVSPLSRVLSVLQAQEYKLIYDVSAIVLIVVAFLLAKSRHFSFLDFVAAISLAAFLGYVIYAILIVTVVEMRLRGAGHGVR